MKNELKYMIHDFRKVVRTAGFVKCFFAFLIAVLFGLIFARTNMSLFLIVVVGMYLYWYFQARYECKKMDV